MISHFHQQGRAAGSVVRADKDAAGVPPIVIGIRPRIIMAGDKHALGRLGMPAHDEIGHANRLARNGVGAVKGLKSDLGPQAAEMLGQKSLLFRHPPAATGPRTDATDFFEISKRPSGVQDRPLRLPFDSGRPPRTKGRAGERGPARRRDRPISL